jgi:hypothetical protein
VFDQEAAEGPVRPAATPAPQPLRPAYLRETPAPEPTPVSEPVAEEPMLDFDAPPLPLGIVDPAARPDAPAAAVPRNRSAAKREHSDEERAARARIPSWDDILLGVRRKSD